MHLVTNASIQVFSSLSVVPFAVLPGGGWKATLRPSCSGSCLCRASRRDFGSREKPEVPGPTEVRAGRVIETLLRLVILDGTEGTGVPDGEAPRTRLRRFSTYRERGSWYRQKQE